MMRYRFRVYNYSDKLHGCLIQVETSTSTHVGAVGHYHYDAARQEFLAKLIDISAPIVKLCTAKNPTVVEVHRRSGCELDEVRVTWDNYCITPKGSVKRFNPDGSITEWPTIKQGFQALLDVVHEDALKENLVTS